jgi:hypothetical protein
MRPALPLLLAILLAGCVQVGGPGGGSGDGDAADAALRFLPPVAVSREWPGSEPVIAVASDGTVYVEGVGNAGNNRGNVNKVWRSDDRGATWVDVTPPALGQERSNDGFVAVGNGDRVYAANVFSLSFQVYRSDDKGATWTPLNVPRLPALMHRHWIAPVGERTVHVTVEALPPSYAPRLVGLPVEGPETLNEGMWYFRSDDLGETWTQPVRIDPQVNFAGQGNMAVSADGQKLYVVRYEEEVPVSEQTYEKGHWYLLASEDGGATWERREMFDLTSELASALPSTSIDGDGTLYVAWSQERAGVSRTHLSVSKDGGATWSAPLHLALPDGTHAMSWIDVRAPGTLGLMWYAADEEGRASKLDAPWFVDYALVARADTPEPLLRHVRVTPEPIHEGNVCAKGPACVPPEDRRLLDYPWVDFGPDGAAHLVFASTGWDRPSAFAVVAREDLAG